MGNLLKREIQGTTVRTKSEQDFQKRVEKVLSEKQRVQEKQHAQQTLLPPEMRKNLEKVKMLLEKAAREEGLGKIPRVIGRYEYILELYKSIPKDTLDLSEKIVEIENKIALLRTKM